MNPHFVEMLNALRDEGVEHLVIGAHALAAHAYVRATLEIDIWVRPSAENAARVWRALERFQAPLAKMRPGDFAEPEMPYQIGVPPSRIDIMTSVTGLEFDTAWPRRIMAAFAGIEVEGVGGQDLRASKRAAGRLKNLADLEELG